MSVCVHLEREGRLRERERERERLQLYERSNKAGFLYGYYVGAKWVSSINIIKNIGFHPRNMWDPT